MSFLAGVHKLCLGCFLGAKTLQVTYYSKLTHEDVILSWNWTSDMPLECTSHYVKIRCYINATQFVGPKDWSDWSPAEVIPGMFVPLLPCGLLFLYKN